MKADGDLADWLQDKAEAGLHTVNHRPNKPLTPTLNPLGPHVNPKMSTVDSPPYRPVCTQIALT